MIQRCHLPDFDLGYELMVKQMNGITLSDSELQILQNVTSVVDSQIEQMLQTIQL